MKGPMREIRIPVLRFFYRKFLKQGKWIMNMLFHSIKILKLIFPYLAKITANLHVTWSNSFRTERKENVW